MTYIDREYYGSLYPQIPEADFARLYKQAAGKLDAYTHMRASAFYQSYCKETATLFQQKVYTQIQDTVCALINAMYEQEKSGIGKGIASVSNDGYSESYKITTAEEQEAQLVKILKSGLSGSGLAGVL